MAHERNPAAVVVGLGVGGRGAERRAATLASPARWPDGSATAPWRCGEPAHLDDVELRPSRLTPPAALAAVCSAERRDRASHTYGKSYRDVVRGLPRRARRPARRRRLPHRRGRRRRPARLVRRTPASPPSRTAAVRRSSAASRPGSSATDFAGVVSIDLTRLDRVLEIDRVAGRRASRPALSGRCSRTSCDPTATRSATSRSRSSSRPSADGWPPARAATTPACTPTSTTWSSRCGSSRRPASRESRRLPGSGAGPVARPPLPRLGRNARRHHRGVDAGAGPARASRRRRACASPIYADRRRRRPGPSPSRACSPPTAGCSTRPRRRCRPASTTVGALLVLGFESADHPVDAWIERAVELCRDHGGDGAGRRSRISDAGDAAARRRAADGRRRRRVAQQLPAGALHPRRPRADGRDRRDVRDGVHVGRASPRCTPASPRRSTRRLRRDLRRRLGHLPVHPRVPRRPRALLQRVRARAASARSCRCGPRSRRRRPTPSCAHGGTITHHHAVGRDHDRWYDHQRPDLFATALAAVKAQLDPAGILNPGVLDRPITPRTPRTRRNSVPTGAAIASRTRGVRRPGDCVENEGSVAEVDVDGAEERLAGGVAANVLGDPGRQQGRAICGVLPVCGVMTQLGADQSGWPSGSGSGSVTSSAAPPIEPV